MRFLIIGLGSMGKRRIRNLRALQAGEVIGFDPRADRCEEAGSTYGIQAYTDFDQAMSGDPDALIISTPPDLHMRYAHIAADSGKCFFTEAGVTDGGMTELIGKLAQKTTIGVPSCTMRFFPGPRRIKQLLDQGRIGKPLSFTYHSGQYLPDWHPWEDYRSFYVSKKETGACREIVPFEMVWLIWVFGQIDRVSCMKDKVSGFDAEIDDIYQLLLRFRTHVMGHLMVDVIARPAVRCMRILGTEGTIEWLNDQGVIRVSKGSGCSWDTINLHQGTVQDNYINPEEPYIEEMRRFINAIQGVEDFGHSFEEDHQILQILYYAEQSSGRSEHVHVKH
jgi:predicted dehydrogenase